MRKILLLALVAPLFVACATGGGTGVSPFNANQGDPERALRAAQPGSGQNAGGGAGIVTGVMEDGSRPTVERGAGGGNVGCPPGTRPVPVNTTRGDSIPRVECR